jgi:hypothetical protein
MAEFPTDAAPPLQARDTKLRVFLSCSRRDSGFIARLASALQARGLGKRVIAVLRRPIDFATAPPRLAALNVKTSFVDDAFDRSVGYLVLALERDVVCLREHTRLTLAAADWDVDRATLAPAGAPMKHVGFYSRPEYARTGG